MNKISKEEFNNTKKLIKQLWDEEVDDVIDTIVNSGNEHWYPIDDFEGMYSVSNLGRVRNDRTGHILKNSGNWFEDWDGDFCKCYGLSKNGKRINFYVKDPFITLHIDYNNHIILNIGGNDIPHCSERKVFKNVYEASEYTNVPIDDILDNCHYYKGKSKLFNKDGIPLIFGFGV